MIKSAFMEFAAVGYVLRLAQPRTDCNNALLSRYFCHRSLLLKNIRGTHMLHYAVVFFVIALIAAFFGFGGIAVGAAGIAKILFIVFLIGAVVTFLMSLGRRV
jgi:uncharacterized membrane protein YtjA (UPF0391 family)